MIYLQIKEQLKLRTDGELIQLVPGQVVSVSEQQATQLLETGRAVQIEPHEVMYHAADEVDKKYLPGCVDWIKANRAELWADIQTVEQQITVVYIAQQDIQPVVGKWLDLWKAAILAYNTFFSDHAEEF